MSHLMGHRWFDVVKSENVTFLGCSPYSIEFAVQTRKYILENRPDLICVQAPNSLRDQILTSVRKLPYHSVIIFQTSEDENGVWIVEGSDGVIEAIRSGLELGTPVWFVDPTPFRLPTVDRDVSEPFVVDLIGQKTYLELTRSLDMDYKSQAENPRNIFMASRLREGAKKFDQVLYVGELSSIKAVFSLFQEPQALPLMKTGVKRALANSLHPESLKKGFSEIPKILQAYEEARESGESVEIPNRHDLIINLMGASIKYFESFSHQETPDYVRLTWSRFLRKWLSSKKMLLPDLYHLVSSARSAMDEDFAYHVHEFICDYKWANDPQDPFSTILDEDSFMFQGHKIKLHKKLRNFFHSPSKRYKLKAVRSSKWKEHLKKTWEAVDPNEVDVCSYPPEDVEIERWGESLMKHARHLMQASFNDVEPFVSDLGAGPDVRETLRRFYEKRIYVKSHEHGGMEFGSVVVIFDEDIDGTSYPFTMTWLGEHSQESDMAFYSTEPGANLVGSGISRLEHGGFLMSYPPLRMYDVWKDPGFDFIDTKHEKLLVAGIVYSEKSGIVYAAKKAPEKKWKRLAQRMGKRVIYIPLGSLNPAHVRKMRSFHMLQNKGLRNIAHEYLKKS
ncbi:MAG: hypothetical protein AB7V04_00350 [Desulfomonilaceae bacterium]